MRTGAAPTPLTRCTANKLNAQTSLGLRNPGELANRLDRLESFSELWARSALRAPSVDPQARDPAEQRRTGRGVGTYGHPRP